MTSSFEEVITTTTYFTTTETFVDSIEQDVGTISLVAEVDRSGDTFLDQFRGMPIGGSIMVLGNAISDKLTTSTGACFQAGTFPTSDKASYLECLPNPALVLKPVIRKCPENFVYSFQIGSCVKVSEVDILREDLGYRMGPGSNVQLSVEGAIAPFDFQDFIGSIPSCQAPGPNPLQEEDRVYILCQNANDRGK